MTRHQKYAASHLAVAGATAVAVGILFAVTGNPLAAMAGFSLLALIGFAEIFWRRGDQRPTQDERDEEIARKAGMTAYVVFWIAFVGWGTILTTAFAASGTVPVVYVAPAVWVASWLVLTVRAAAILSLDARGS